VKHTLREAIFEVQRDRKIFDGDENLSNIEIHEFTGVDFVEQNK
jgi:hypothetical protein